MSLNTIQRTLGFAFVGASLLLTQPVRAMADEDQQDNSFVYVMTNQATDNTVLVFQRNADGSLKMVQEVSTHGLGTGGSGDPLGSQGALRLASEGRLLLAINAGSNEVSSLAVSEGGLQFVSKAPSGGTQPVSVTGRGDTAYVLNAGGTPNVTAFRIGLNGQLTMIPNSMVALPGGANCSPAQVGITPDSEVLVVTEKNTNQIDLFSIDDAGQLSAPSSVPSNGATPFGFAFGQDQTLIVSEATASTFSSYHIRSANNALTLQTITKSLPDLGAAACWIVTDRRGRLAFTTNSGTSTISSLTVSAEGTLQLLAAVAASTGSGSAPIDLALTHRGDFLYALSTSNGTLTGFRVQNGGLSQVASLTGLPLSIQGIAAR